jgi:ADP-ribosyl-[dinitrogen reductase] hydrolase
MKRRDSETDPIMVNYLPQQLVRTRGRIGLTFAPGKKATGVHGRWDRDLESDLTRLTSVYKTHVLVSLVESAELEALAIPGLLVEARSHGMKFLHFPFRDGGAPSTVAAAHAMVTAVLEVIAKGGNVVIHCRGGLGRSGLVAACCLVGLGEAAEDAIGVVRAARPGAVETRGQEAFIADYARAHRGDVVVGRETRVGAAPSISRIRGCLLGGAVGDALGYPIEFEHSSAAIISAHGRAAPSTIAAGAGPALVSDDTQMTLFVAEGVIRGIQRGRDRGISSMECVIRHALIRWYITQVPVAPEGIDSWPGWLVGDRRLHARRAPGIACLSSLQSQISTGTIPTIKTPPNDSKGCGAVMRSAPIGLAAGSRDLAFSVGRDAGVITHGHPSGYLSAACLASLVFDVSRGMRLDDALDHACVALEAEVGHEEMWRAIGAARALAKRGKPSPQAVESLGGGWTGEEALAIGLLCALTAEGSSPEGVADALWRSVAHGGDSDSTGSIAGNLLGAMYGVENLPPAWVQAVELQDIIERLSDDLYAAAVTDSELDYESYPPN